MPVVSASVDYFYSLRTNKTQLNSVVLGVLCCGLLGTRVRQLNAQAIDQLRGEETRRLIDAGGVVDETYTSQRKLKKQAAQKKKKTTTKTTAKKTA